MAYLDQFSADEKNLLISLPYRAGLWVSASDATGGHTADEKELEALAKSIQGLSQGMFESALVHEVMAETFLHRAEWPVWAKNYGVTPDDCKRAIALMQARKVPPRDVDAFRRMLMQIGLEVARAFREYDRNEPFSHRLVRQISILVDSFFGALQGEKHVSEDILNISYSEDIALNALAMALRGEIDLTAESTVSNG
jgi:hypothetical protein